MKDGRGYFLAGMRIPRLGKSMRGTDRVVGMFNSSDFFPPSGTGSETTILSLLNWYRNKLSLLAREAVLKILTSYMRK